MEYSPDVASLPYDLNLKLQCYEQLKSRKHSLFPFVCVQITADCNLLLNHVAMLYVPVDTTGPQLIHHEHYYPPPDSSDRIKPMGTAGSW